MAASNARHFVPASVWTSCRKSCAIVPLSGLSGRRPELRDRHAVADVGERHLERHADADVGEVAVDHVADGLRALVELDDRGDVGHPLVERWEVVHPDDGVRVERGAAARRLPLDPLAPASRAERTRVERGPTAIGAPLDQEPAVPASVPERLRVVVRLRQVEPQCFLPGWGPNPTLLHSAGAPTPAMADPDATVSR